MRIGGKFCKCEQCGKWVPVGHGLLVSKNTSDVDAFVCTECMNDNAIKEAAKEKEECSSCGNKGQGDPCIHCKAAERGCSDPNELEKHFVE